MNVQQPANIAQRIESALKGSVFTYIKSRRSTTPIVESMDIITPYSDKSRFTSTELSRHIFDKKEGQESRHFAELRWAYSVAEGINLISGFQIYDKNTTKSIRDEIFKERTNVRNIRKSLYSAGASGADVYRNPELVAAIDQYQTVWAKRFDAAVVGEATLKNTLKEQQSLLNDFIKNAVALGCIDHDSLRRLKPVISEFLADINQGKKYNEILTPSRIDAHYQLLYREMLVDVYGTDASSLSHLAQRMLEKHVGEMQSYANGLSYSGSKSKKKYDFDINLNEHVSGALINLSTDSKVKPISSSLSTGKNKRNWSAAISMHQFDDGGVCLTGIFGLAGRRNESFSIAPSLKEWSDALPCSVDPNVQAMTNAQAEAAYNERVARREAEMEKANAEYEVLRQERERVYAAEEAKRAAEVQSAIDRNYEATPVTRDSVRNTYLEVKKLERLLDYPELHGLMQHGNYWDVPCVTISMGPNTEDINGLQYLANRGLSWQPREDDDPINKMFEVKFNDMKNNFVQFGTIKENTVIVTAEGFATGGSLYIAAKEAGWMSLSLVQCLCLT